jgi:hypothetical protein
MTKRILRNAVAGCLSLTLSLLAACGAPSSYEICNTACETTKKCVGATDVQLANCHTTCDNNKGLLSDSDAKLARDCKNASDIRKTQFECYNLACLETISCLGKNTDNALCIK